MLSKKIFLQKYQISIFSTIVAGEPRTFVLWPEFRHSIVVSYGTFSRFALEHLKLNYSEGDDYEVFSSPEFRELIGPIEPTFPMTVSLKRGTIGVVYKEFVERCSDVVERRHNLSGCNCQSKLGIVSCVVGKQLENFKEIRENLRAHHGEFLSQLQGTEHSLLTVEEGMAKIVEMKGKMEEHISAVQLVKEIVESSNREVEEAHRNYENARKNYKRHAERLVNLREEEKEMKEAFKEIVHSLYCAL